VLKVGREDELRSLRQGGKSHLITCETMRWVSPCSVIVLVVAVIRLGPGKLGKVIIMKPRKKWAVVII
jgi:hypothetical protein